MFFPWLSISGWFIHFSTFAYFCPMVLIEYSMNLSFLPSFLPSLVIVFSDPYSCFV